MMDQTVTALSPSPASTGEVSVPSQDRSPDLRSAAQLADEDTLAAMYIRMWSLATGRRLEPGVRPEELPVSELVDFWADDLSPAPGRHAAPDAGTAEDAR